MYNVYWIKYKNHTDPYKEGYIGISNDVKSRFRYHSGEKSSDNPILFKAIMKGAELTLLEQVGSKEEALELEKKFRPLPNIGWNIIAGGISPPSQKGKKFKRLKTKKHSEDTKLLMSQQRQGTKWWNNGEKNLRSDVQPEGYVLGRLVKYDYKLSEQGKLNLGKSGKKISTPYGIFNTIREAANVLNLTEDKIYYKLKKEKFTDWFYIKN